ncbi:FAD binding domain-containing protein [Umezawaea sp. NPDC059074]|uniref:FAD binding domain-containing protein n=1 Tax=Umezawaea sp. NPDC059074 TaxID=3346716 RepID=UPI0036B3AC94
MDLNTVTEVLDARERRPWLPGDAWLAGGTYLFSEPQPGLRRLVDLSRTGWTPVQVHGDGSVEIAATCTVVELARFECAVSELVVQCCRAFLASFKVWNLATVGGNLCNALPAGPMISLTAALDGSCLLVAQDGTERRALVRDFVVGPGEHVLAEGELLRSITLPAKALTRRTAFRQVSLYGLGRSGALVIGTAGAEFTVTVTASTTRPVHLVFAETPSEEDLRAEIDRVAVWFDDIHGLPAWRRHMTLRLAEEIRRELVGG